jgi:TonB family protein
MIGYAMLYTIVVSVPLVAAAMFVAHFLQTHGRPERAVWVVASAATLVVPAIMLSRPVHAPAEAWLPPIQVELVPTPATSGPAEAVAAQSGGAPLAGQAPVDLDTLLLGAWILASLALATRWIVSSVRLNRLSQSWLRETVEGVPVWLAPELGPAVTGVLRPRVVVPAWVPALSDEQRVLVLLHEQEHVRARDPWLMTVARLTRIITPWNPATWLLSSRLKRAVELDCDRRVLRRHPSVEAYGETLLAVSARGSNRLLSAAAFAESDVPLWKRILAMTTPPRAASAIGVLVTVAVGSTLVSSAIAVPVPAMRVLPAPAVVLPGLMAEVPEASGESEWVNLSNEISTHPDADRAQPVADTGPGRVGARQFEQVQMQPLPDPRVIADPRLEWIDGGSFVGPRSTLVMWQSTNFREPRVIADPRFDWLMIYRISDLRNAGNRLPEPVGRLPLSGPPDSLIAMAREMYGDSILTVPFDGSWPGNAPPEPTIPPRIRNPAEVMNAIAAEYPRDFRDRGMGGTIGMHFLLNTTGRVEAIRIGQISAYPALDEAAVRVARVYRFTPAMRGPDAIPVWVSHAISFYPPQ